MDCGNSSSTKESKVKETDCTICLQPLFQPVKLPCNHCFCFLCAKGIIQQSNKCALCRKDIPQNYLSNPQFVQQHTGTSTGSHKWFYQGQSGSWWQYDDRTNSEIENAHQNQQQQCEVLIAGTLYIIDFSRSMQMQKFNPTRSRAIKRDLETVPKRGIAGVYGNFNALQDSTVNDKKDPAFCTIVTIDAGNKPGISGISVRTIPVVNSKESSSSGTSNSSACQTSSSKSIGVQTIPTSDICSDEEKKSPSVNTRVRRSPRFRNSNGNSVKIVTQTVPTSNLCSDGGKKLPSVATKVKKGSRSRKTIGNSVEVNTPTVSATKTCIISDEDKELPSNVAYVRRSPRFRNTIGNSVKDSNTSHVPQRNCKRSLNDAFESMEEEEMDKTFATMVFSKLQQMEKKQRLFSEKLINDTLFKGLLGKLSENSCLSETQ